MNTTIDSSLKQILLRRRNKVIIESDQNICDIFRENVLKRFDSYKSLKDCTIEDIDEISISIKIQGVLLRFVNGILEGDAKEFENFKNEYNDLSTIIKEETEKIQKKMALALSFNENIGNLGYSMDQKMFRIVSTFSVKEINALSEEVVPYLKDIVGANVTYVPLYPNFPNQVIEAKNIELYLIAIFHYWSGGKYKPYFEVKDTDKEPILIQYKNITVGTEKDVHEIMYNLMNAAEAISEQDINDLKCYFENYKDFANYIPETIVNKENLAVVSNLIIKNSEEVPIDKLLNKFATVTDVLRLAAVMSGVSASLSNKTRFKSFSNKERRLLMQLLNNCGNRIEDLYRYQNLWERVCEKIHPSKFQNIYPDLVDDLMGVYKYKMYQKSFKKESGYYQKVIDMVHQYEIQKKNKRPLVSTESDFIDIINNLQKIKPKVPKNIIDHIKDIKLKMNNSSDDNDESVNIDISPINKRIKIIEDKSLELPENIKDYKNAHQRYSTKVESALELSNFNEALDLLSQRPGIFSRRLDELLSKVEDHELVLKYFEDIAFKVSVKVLLSLKGYFQKRHERLKVRVFLIKGTTSKLYMKTTVKEKLDMSLCERICLICDQALKNHFKDKPKINNVYLSESLKKQYVPLDIRSASSALETYSKGSRFDMSFKKLTEEEQKEYIRDLETEIEEYRSTIQENKDKQEELEKQKEEMTDMDNEVNEKIETIEKEIDSIKEKMNRCYDRLDFARSRFGNNKCNKVRLFIWWTNTKSNIRVDIDLSAMIYNSDFQQLSHVSFTSLRDSKFEVYHSGDIVDGGDVNGQGAAEFIDFDPDKIVENGGRYVTVSVISFCGTPFKDLDNCKFGWMERESLNSNELFEPKTVRQKLDLNVNNTSTTPIIFDCETREIIWVDTTLISQKSCICIENSKTPMNAILYYYTNPMKVSMYDLLNLHIQAREGKLVSSEEELDNDDIAFVPCLPYKCKEGVKYIRPTDLDIILSEYMTSSL